MCSYVYVLCLFVRVLVFALLCFLCMCRHMFLLMCYLRCVRMFRVIICVFMLWVCYPSCLSSVFICLFMFRRRIRLMFIIIGVILIYPLRIIVLRSHVCFYFVTVFSYFLCVLLILLGFVWFVGFVSVLCFVLLLSVLLLCVSCVLFVCLVL